jgi:hypothetical protein
MNGVMSAANSAFPGYAKNFGIIQSSSVGAGLKAFCVDDHLSGSGIREALRTQEAGGGAVRRHNLKR